MNKNNYTKMERMRSYSSVFSRSMVTDVIKYNDFSRLNVLFHRYDDEIGNLTYIDYLKFLYKTIKKNYRCEYVYKNEIINNLLLKKYGTQNTIAINEYKVGNSIADLVMFNGVSRAFEIKTEYDTTKRLEQQLEDYSKLFQQCYIVVPKELLSKYEGFVSENIGIVVLFIERDKVKLKEVRKSTVDNYIDVSILIRSVRTSEYKNIVFTHFGRLPDVSCYEMFDACEEWMRKIPQVELNKLFLTEIKKRKSSTQLLEALPTEIRQIGLSMNLSKEQSFILLKKLSNPIKL